MGPTYPIEYFKNFVKLKRHFYKKSYIILNRNVALGVHYPGNWIHSTLRCHLFLLEGYKMDQLPDAKEVLK